METLELSKKNITRTIINFLTKAFNELRKGLYYTRVGAVHASNHNYHRHRNLLAKLFTSSHLSVSLSRAFPPFPANMKGFPLHGDGLCDDGESEMCTAENNSGEEELDSSCASGVMTNTAM